LVMERVMDSGLKGERDTYSKSEML
jgi:hypothetical protein